MKTKNKSLAISMSALLFASVVAIHTSYAEDGNGANALESGAAADGLSPERQELKEVNQKIHEKNAEIRKERVEKRALRQERRKLRRQIHEQAHPIMKK